MADVKCRCEPRRSRTRSLKYFLRAREDTHKGRRAPVKEISFNIRLEQWEAKGQLFEILNNTRLIDPDGRPLPKNPEPWFHGSSAARWEGDTLVIESIGFDERNLRPAERVVP